MRNLIKSVSALALLALSHTTLAANFGSEKPFLCAIQSISECVSGQACQGVTTAAVNLPDFFVVNPVAKFLGATTADGAQRTTPIERSELIDGKFVVQGADDGVEGVRDGLAWSMAIDETSGKLALSAVGDSFALVAFGACTAY